MEALYSINFAPKTPPSFSAQYLLDCDTNNFGCEGGWMTDSYSWLMDHGIVEWNDYPNSYMKKASKCLDTSKKSKFFNKGANEAENPSNEQIKELVAQGPVGAAYYSDLGCMNRYKSGTLKASDCAKDCSNPENKRFGVNHAVTIVGYGTSERADCDEYWLIKNSWGTTWGDNGHFKWCADRKDDTLQFGGCQIASYIMWPSM